MCTSKGKFLISMLPKMGRALMGVGRETQIAISSPLCEETRVWVCAGWQDRLSGCELDLQESLLILSSMAIVHQSNSQSCQLYLNILRTESCALLAQFGRRKSDHGCRLGSPSFPWGTESPEKSRVRRYVRSRISAVSSQWVALWLVLLQTENWRCHCADAL